MSGSKGKDIAEGSSRAGENAPDQQNPPPLSRYESQKRRDWNTFRSVPEEPETPSCIPEPPGPCTCPLKQAWGSLDALIGRLRAAYEENGGLPETNPFASGAIRVYLREVRDSQAKARGIPYKKKKKKRNPAKANDESSSFHMQ
ncbi:hypothetical protein OIU84_002910 [Salix udensis]|uniref:ALOG domain-containing protein n=1 Tax=Salix udensis TaxID=889485 RepID=A0AAD6K521_9ROSI|nr:hypothetical protein OIU84_002910 [Salix udensis]